MTVKCPICKKPVELTDAEFPFCSGRCRILDLGAWASEEYVVSEPASPNALSDPEDDGE